MPGAPDKTNPSNYGLTPREVDLIIKAMTTLVENNVKVCTHSPSNHPFLLYATPGLQRVGCRTNTLVSTSPTSRSLPR